MKPISVAIVGAGGMGNVHFQNYKHIEGVSIAAVVDKNAAARSRADEWGVPYFSSLDAVTVPFDVADICAPTFLHKELVMRALSLGKNVICEKPLALSEADGAELFFEAERRGLRLYTALVLQFTKAVEYLHKIVDKKTYGAPCSAHFFRLSECPSWSKDSWLFEKEKSGFIPYDLHIHDLDIIVSLFGEPENARYYANGRTSVPYPEHATFIYEYENLTVTAEAAWYNAPFPFTAGWRVEFENAVIVCSGNDLTVYPAGGEAFRVNIDDEVTVATGINVPPVGWYYNELSAFTECLRRDEDCQRVSKRQVLAVLKILDKLTKDD
ncbi:Gfo/Idh/MocA family protein [Treponema socranskii]|uniref:Gfo/Idh/MocA family protein n=1 Tax=Treponema socranskii TaxID=53419 RepID=UPI0023F4209D|nr:Gfo/Idh/MocA family oxidoreductase [Treponema socranskii]